MTLLVGRADGVRSVGHGRAGHALHEAEVARPGGGAAAAREVSVRAVWLRAVGAAAGGAAGAQEERVLGGEAGVLRGDGGQPQRGHQRVARTVLNREPLLCICHYCEPIWNNNQIFVVATYGETLQSIDNI